MKKELTVRELRQALFNVENQNLTVGELRQLLFEIKDQEQVIDKAIYDNKGRKI